MSETKEFPTLVVASTVTGIGLCEGLNYSKMQECAEWLCGHPVWTHELAYQPIIDRYKSEGYRQFPQFPSVEEAETDYAAAAQKAIAAYGEVVSVEKGEGKRDGSPMQTILAMKPDAEVVTLVVDGPHDH